MKFWFQSQANKCYTCTQINQSLVYLFLLQAISICLAEYGEPCSDAFSCGEDNKYSCIDKVCKCSPDFNLKYTMGASPICVGGNFLDALLVHLRKNSTCEPSCIDNQICSNGTCECKEDFVTSTENDTCHKFKYAKPLEECGIQEIATLCDPKQFSICSWRKCVCFKSYYYNFTTKECMPKEKDYKALYNEYCRLDTDCYEGLTCQSNQTCKCSHNCVYKEEFGSCDCGAVTIETPSDVIITGVALGLASVIFWAIVIKKTYAKADSKNLTSDDVGEENPLDHPYQESFPTANLPYGSNQRTNEPIPLVDNPPPYDEAVSSDQKPPMGFIVGQALPGDAAPPYIPSYPPPQPTSQAPYPYPTSPIPNMTTEPTAPLQPYPYPTNSLSSETAPSFSSQNLPYSFKPEEPSDKNTNISPYTPYPISPTQGTGNK